MKAYKLIIVTLFIAVLILSISDCEYDGPTPPERKQALIPEITGIEPPDSAAAGVNYITIFGKDFADVPEDNVVYFNEIKEGKVINFIKAEIVVNACSDTSIKVRRPNLSGDSCLVKVVWADSALLVAQHGPYKIDPVVDPSFGSFIEVGVELGAIAVDSDENVYVVQNSTLPSIVFKVTPEGGKTIVGQGQKSVSDAKIGPDGKKLIMLRGKKEIYQLDLGAGDIDTFATVPKIVKYGDFDSTGNFYAGGKKSDLFVIAPGAITGVPIGVYGNDEILCVRVYNDYVYVLAKAPEWGIWRHQILEGGNSLYVYKEPVLNWSEAGDFANSNPKTFTLSKEGIMYIGTDNPNSVMIYDTVNKTTDILYKGILPSNAEKMVWGTKNYIYMIVSGGTEGWKVVRIDMGADGAGP